MTIIRNSNEADGTNTFPATVETAGQAYVTVSTPEGTRFGGQIIKVQAPAGHGLAKGDGVLIDSRGFLVIEGGDDTETEQTPASPAPTFTEGVRVRITGERFNGRTGTVTDESGTADCEGHWNHGRAWVGVKLDQNASAYTPRTRQWLDDLELETPVSPAPARNIQRGRGQIHAADATEGYMPTPRCGGNRSAEGYRETSGPVTCKNCRKILAKETAAELCASRLSLEEALEEANTWADQNGSDWGIGRMEDIGRLSLAEALDAAYERVEQDRGNWGIAVTYAPRHEQRGEKIEPGTLLRNTRSGQVGKALGEHGVFFGSAWVKVQLMAGEPLRALIDGEDGETRWSLCDTVRVAADTVSDDGPVPFTAPVAIALPKLSPKALEIVKRALYRPYGLLPKHTPFPVSEKLVREGLAEFVRVPKLPGSSYFQERHALTRKAFTHFGLTMVDDPERLELSDALEAAEYMFETRELDRLHIVWPSPVPTAEIVSVGQQHVMVSRGDSPVFLVLVRRGHGLHRGDTITLDHQGKAADASIRHPEDGTPGGVRELAGSLTEARDDYYSQTGAWTAMDKPQQARDPQPVGTSPVPVPAVFIPYSGRAAGDTPDLELELSDPRDRWTDRYPDGRPYRYRGALIPADLAGDWGSLAAIAWARGVVAGQRKGGAL